MDQKISKIYRQQIFKEPTTKYAYNPRSYKKRVSVIDNTKEKYLWEAQQLEEQLKEDVSCSINKELVYSKAMDEFYRKNKLFERQRFGDIVVPQSGNNQQIYNIIGRYYKKIDDVEAG